MIKFRRIKIRSKSQHIWIRGVLIFGLSAFLFGVLVKWLLNDSLDIPYLIISLIIWPACGYFWAVWTWRLAHKERNNNNENKY